MPKVTFLPINQTVDAHLGESLLDVALRHDIPIQHACGGFCSCTTCHCYVKDHPQNLAPMDEDEKERIEWVEGFRPESRLGCQAKVKGDVVVQIVNLDL